MFDGPGAHVDFETRSVTDLKKSGVYRYAEDPTTAPWGFSWLIEGMNQPQTWRPGYPDPVPLLDHIRQGGRFVAHGAQFERTIWNEVLVPRFVPHWPKLTIEQQDCTMARAAAIAMPQDLDRLGIALNTHQKKDRDGGVLMKKMAKPRKFLPDGSIEWWDTPENRDRLEAYQQQDVRTEVEADQLLPPLTADEKEAWDLDQKINERGVYIDVSRIAKLASLVDLAQKAADAEMRRLTNRAVPKCTTVGQIISWLDARGIPCESLKKQQLDDYIFIAYNLNDDLTAKAVIELRQSASKTSTKKYSAMLLCVSRDGRIRGLLNYHGATTGRWAGRLVQPHNFPRLDEDEDVVNVEWLHRLLDDPSIRPPELLEYIEACHGPLEPLRLLSVALRSCIEAAPGNILIGGDFSNIEGRVNAWLANEHWKLQAFRDYDNGTGPDLYRVAYARSFGVDVATVGKGPKRQIGKVQELMLGYQGAIGAFFGPTVKMSPYDVSNPVKQATSAEQWERTELEYYVPGTARFDLQVKEWCALKIMVDNWRAANPNIVQSWWDYQDAAIQAVMTPGTIVYCGGNRVQYYSDTRTLWCILPSGRMLAYNRPRLETTKEIRISRRTGEEYEQIKHTVWFEGTNPITKQWGPRSLYGGLQCENIVQAVSRDIMYGAMKRSEKAGYPIILTVHDELLTEPSEDLLELCNLNAENFAALMGAGETWTEGLPIAVAAWQDKRYIK